MLGSIIEGTRSAALEIMIGAQSMVVHKSFDIGEYLEFDAHKECFVNESGNDITAALMTDDIYHTGWREWSMDDENALEDEEDRLYLLSQRSVTFTVIPRGTTAYMLKSNKIIEVTISGFQHTIAPEKNSISYYVKYKSGGVEWVDGDSVCESKESIVEKLLQGEAV